MKNHLFWRARLLTSSLHYIEVSFTLWIHCDSDNTVLCFLTIGEVPPLWPSSPPLWLCPSTPSCHTLCRFNTEQIQYCASSTQCKTIHDSSVIHSPLCLYWLVIRSVAEHFDIVTLYHCVSWCIAVLLVFGPTCPFNTNPQQSTLSNTAC